MMADFITLQMANEEVDRLRAENKTIRLAYERVNAEVFRLAELLRKADPNGSGDEEMNLQLYPSWLKPQRPTFEGSVRGIKWDADGTVRRSTRPRVCVVDGVQYPSVNQASKACGVSYMTMLRRVR